MSAVTVVFLAETVRDLPFTPSGFVVTTWLLSLTLSTLSALFETWVHRCALLFFLLTDPMRRSPEK